MHKTKKYLFIGAVAAAVLFSRATTHAATLSFISDVSGASIGDTIDVSVRIDSQGQTVNAAQGTIQYPSSILQVASVDHSNSIFNIWAQEPSVNSSTGEISFLGGSTNSFSGTSLYILDVKFTVKGSGLATLDFANAGVTSGDGTGANILDGTNPLSITIGGAAGAPSVTPSSTPAAASGTTTGSSGAGGNASSTAIVPAPVPVMRTAVAATGLPAAPVVSVPLYPQQGAWYNVVGDTIVQWDIPADVTQVETRVSHTKDTVAGTVQKELLTGQDIGVLAEGQWYVRVRFRNNIGWSSYTYYSIQIDTTPPLPFTVGISSTSSDDPAPEINFATSDSLSGIKDYAITVDGTPLMTTASTTLTLPVQKPGKHTLTVQAYDLAGNAVASSIAFEIIPLPSPQLVFVTPSASEGEPVFISGTATPADTIDVRVLDDKNQSVFESTTTANNAGDWNMTVSQDIPEGHYTASVMASDARGAMSNPVESKTITMRDRIIFSIGSFDFDWFEMFLIVVLIVLIIAGLIWHYLSRRTERRQAFTIIARRDAEKLSDLLTSQLEEAQKRFQGIAEETSSTAKTELGEFLTRAQDTVLKMKKYLGEEIEKTK
jgi:hypothetical protein